MGARLRTSLRSCRRRAARVREFSPADLPGASRRAGRGCGLRGIGPDRARTPVAISSRRNPTSSSSAMRTCLRVRSSTVAATPSHASSPESNWRSSSSWSGSDGASPGRRRAQRSPERPASAPAPAPAPAFLAFRRSIEGSRRFGLELAPRRLHLLPGLLTYFRVPRIKLDECVREHRGRA